MSSTERLAAIEARLSAATDGPWAPWTDQDGAEHMHGLLMVGNAAAVIPDGESWVEGVDVNPIAHTYTPEDRELVAHAPTDLAALVTVVRAVQAVVAEHQGIHDEWRIESLNPTDEEYAEMGARGQILDELKAALEGRS